MADKSDQPSYLLGHSKDELNRLERQSRFFDEETHDTLLRAGLVHGMRVLDVGCGAGDVAMAAAQIVGPAGGVVAIDTSAEAVRLAGERFGLHQYTWATARVSDAYSFDQSGFDAITGRFILMHLSDPAKLLRHLCTALKPGGIVTFLEMDIGSAAITPAMPLFEEGVDAIVAVYRASGSEPNMGSRLFATFRNAGLEPTLRGSCRVEGGPDADVYDYLARSVTSLQSSMAAHGVAIPALQLDTYAEAMKAEASLGEYSVAHPRLTAAWARN